MTAEARHTLLAGLVLGLTAAVLVWWLERFEVERLRRELSAEWRAYVDGLPSQPEPPEPSGE